MREGVGGSRPGPPLSVVLEAPPAPADDRWGPGSGGHRPRPSIGETGREKGLTQRKGLRVGHQDGEWSGLVERKAEGT